MGGPPATRSINYGRVHSLLCEEIRVQGGTSLWVAPTKSPASDGTARRLLHSLAAVPPDPPGGRSAPNLGDIVRIPELLELMTKEIECQRHYIKPQAKLEGELHLKLLALRYGISKDSIRKCNDLPDPASMIVQANRKFLYIPPREHAPP